jgi:hypothetical protein
MCAGTHRVPVVCARCWPTTGRGVSPSRAPPPPGAPGHAMRPHDTHGAMRTPPNSLHGWSQRVQQADIDPAWHLHSTDGIGRCRRMPVPPPRVSCDPHGLRGYVAWTERDPQSGRSSLCQMGLLYDIAARALYTWAAKPEGEPVTTPEPARSRSLVERSPIHGCLRVFPKHRSAGTIMMRIASPRTIATWR